VRVPDFSNVFSNRVRVSGRNILVSSVEPTKNAPTLRIYDVVEGKDIWKQTFNPGTITLTSEDPRLAGVVEPDGTVRVMDVEKRTEVLNAKLASTAHIDRAQAVYLVSDPDYIFLAVNGPADPNVPPWGGGLQTNVLPQSGLRTVPVNGMVYAFSRKTGEINWYNPVENQHLVLSQFNEVPMLLFTARYQYLSPPPMRVAQWRYTARAIAKHNGKLWYFNDTLPPGMFFQALTMDHRSGKVEFIGQNLKVTMTSVPK